MVFSANFRNYKIKMFEGCDDIVKITFNDKYNHELAWLFGDSYEFVPNTLTEITYLTETGIDEIILKTTMANHVVNFVIPEGIEQIAEYVYKDCKGITSVIIPNSVKKIGMGAFFGCSYLVNIRIPFVGSGDISSTIRDYENVFGYIFGYTNTETEGAVYQCTSSYDSKKYYYYIPSGLKTITIGSGIFFVRENAFYGCNKITDVVMENGISQIRGNAFYGCLGIVNIVIPNTVTYIAPRAFYAFGSAEIVIPDSVTNIGDEAFRAAKFETLVIGKGVKKLGKNVFANGSLKKVVWNAENCTEVGEYIIDNAKRYDYTIFSGNTQLSSLIIGNTVKNIPSYAFYNCTEVVDLVIPDSVETIARYAFYGCSGLVKVVIGEGVLSIGSDAFYKCTGIKNVKWHATNCTEAGTSWSPIFDGCTSISTVIIGKNVEIIPDYAFSNCSNLSTVEYNGTMSQWLNVDKGSSYLKGTNVTEIICSDGTSQV